MLILYCIIYYYTKQEESEPQSLTAAEHRGTWRNPLRSRTGTHWRVEWNRSVWSTYGTRPFTTKELRWLRTTRRQLPKACRLRLTVATRLLPPRSLTCPQSAIVPATATPSSDKITCMLPAGFPLFCPKLIPWFCQDFPWHKNFKSIFQDPVVVPSNV